MHGSSITLPSRTKAAHTAPSKGDTLGNPSGNSNLNFPSRNVIDAPNNVTNTGGFTSAITGSGIISLNSTGLTTYGGRRDGFYEGKLSDLEESKEIVCSIVLEYCTIFIEGIRWVIYILSLFLIFTSTFFLFRNTLLGRTSIIQIPKQGRG